MAEGRQREGKRQTEEEEIASAGQFLAHPSDEAYSRLFRVFAPQLIAFFSVRGCEAALAEDLTQEVLLAVYRKSRELRDPSLFRPWLFKIARNAMLQDRRSSQRRIQTTDLESSLPDGVGMVPPHSTDFENWMARLEPDERQIMTLRYIEGLEYHEIATVLELPLGTVQWKIFHSKKKLAALFGLRSK